jgi:hypothetical protein
MQHVTITTVRWDPFARRGLERQTRANHHPLQSCDWCGDMPRRLFQYDGRGWFCNLACRDAWFGV